mmetsp:Transcript_4757/g.6939  ORF Transcript_4757/g.6939 Transcript_4757/m.6939 type:complete len:803 (-) Transcript_4757:78-2486(-)
MTEESAVNTTASGSSPPPPVSQAGSNELGRGISMEAFLREWQGDAAADDDNGLEDFGIGAGTSSQHNRMNSIGSLGRTINDLNDREMMVQSGGGHRISNSLDALDGNIETMRIDSMASDETNGFSSAIHDAARITNWVLVAELSKSDPRAAAYAGPNYWTALHHACSRRCPHADVVESLLSAYPQALVETDDRGWTPLHQACRFKAPKEVVRLLLRAYPELGKRAAGMRNGEGRSALWLALRYDAPKGVADLLLQADPSAVLDEDREGGSPLTLVWDDYANSFQGKRTLQVLLRHLENEGWDSTNDDGAQERIATSERNAKLAMTKSAPACKELQSKWKKVITLLKAYFQFPAEDSDGPPTRKWRVLHAVSAIKCHPTLFLLARALYPEQANEVDENDLLPGNGRDALSLPDPQSSCADRRRSSNRTALHFAAMSPLSGREERSVIKTLLKLNPAAAAHVDGYGSLPLHLLALNDKRIHWVHDGLRDVYDAYPEASLCRDGSGRTPLHCAASAAGNYSRLSSTAAGSESSSNAAQEGSELRSVIQNLVRGNGAAASITDNSGRLPLHYIAEKAEEWNADAQAILDAHPAATSTRSGALTHNQLPLHMAASSTDARPSLIMNLVNANPRAASLVDSMGRLPLHLVCDSGRSTWDRGIDAIYLAYNQAIVIPEDNQRRWTVLHTVVASISASRDLIERVLRMNPGAASLADGDGKLPLHIVCGTNRQWVEGGIQLIFDANPSAALAEDNDGFLPFQIAAMRRTHSSDSDGLDDDGEDWDTEEEDLSVLEIMFNLLNAQPSIVQV